MESEVLSFQREERQGEMTSWSTYHYFYEKLAGVFGEKYRSFYQRIYDNSYDFARESFGRNPLGKETPQVLQCGTASVHTTQSFLSFLERKNRGSKLCVLDRESYPLASCKRALSEKNISFLQEDARCSGIETASIDLLETDRFLQFFPREQRQLLLGEWERVLSEEGVIITRDFLPKGKVGESIDRVRKHVLHSLFPDIEIQKIREEELQEDFFEAGLKLNIESAASMNGCLVRNIVASKTN